MFELGDGTQVQSIGRAYIPFSFSSTEGTLFQRKRWFHVLVECAVPLILGKNFLDEIEVLTKNKRPLKRCSVGFETIPALNFIGTPRTRSGLGISMNK